MTATRVSSSSPSTARAMAAVPHRRTMWPGRSPVPRRTGLGHPAGHQLFLADEEARQGSPRSRGRRPRPRAPIRADALLWSWPCFALAKQLRRLQLMTMSAPPTMVGWIRPPRPLLCPPRPASTSAAAAADLAVASWQQRRQSAVKRTAPRRLTSSLVVSSPARLLLLLRALHLLDGMRR